MPSEPRCARTSAAAGLVALVLTLASGLAGPVGCARTLAETSLVDDRAVAADELEFWGRLEQQRVVTTNDALHGLYVLVDGDDAHETWAKRRDEARRRGWIAPGAEPAANESAPVGMLAVAACDVLSIEGGLTMRLLGPSSRSCTRELVFLDILPPRSEHQSLSGLEFIDLIGRIEDRLDAAEREQ